MVLNIERKDSVWFFFQISFAVVFSMVLSGVISLSLISSFILAYTYILIFALTVRYSDRIKVLSAGMMIVYYSLIEGVGIPLAYIFAKDYTLEQINRSVNFYGRYMDRYIALTLLSVSLMIIGLMVFGRNYTVDYIEDDNNRAELLHKRIFFIIGFAALCFFAIYMTMNLLTGNIVFGDYGAYKEWSGTRIRNYSQICFWISSVLICACGTKKQIGVSLIVFLFPAIILFLSGNRNDVFFPLLIGIGIYHLRFQEIPKVLLAIGAVAVFLLGPLVIQLRNGGDVSVTSIFYNISESIGESFFELGGELHAVSNMFTWIDGGESFAYGATIVLGLVASLFGKFISGLVEYFEASRFYIPSRIPSLGFTMSAEVYFNFSVIGVIIVFMLFGRFMGKSEAKVNRLNDLIWYGFFMLWLLILTRNSFGYSVVYLKVFLSLFIFERIIFSILYREEMTKN